MVDILKRLGLFFGFWIAISVVIYFALSFTDAPEDIKTASSIMFGGAITIIAAGLAAAMMEDIDA